MSNELWVAGVFEHVIDYTSATTPQGELFVTVAVDHDTEYDIVQHTHGWDIFGTDQYVAFCDHAATVAGHIARLAGVQMFSTWNDAVDEIVASLNNSAAVEDARAEYDIDALADRLIVGDGASGYALRGVDAFTDALNELA